jgi:hypothetical protein
MSYVRWRALTFRVTSRAVVERGLPAYCADVNPGACSDTFRRAIRGGNAGARFVVADDESRVPFVARHRPGSLRLIRLQRASMPRLADDLRGTRVEPRGRVLRSGLDAIDVRQRYFLHEEEVPRAGAIVTRSFQRARWFDGKVYTWLGRRKETGRGQGASGLEFDRVASVERRP